MSAQKATSSGEATHQHGRTSSGEMDMEDGNNICRVSPIANPILYRMSLDPYPAMPNMIHFTCFVGKYPGLRTGLRSCILDRDPEIFVLGLLQTGCMALNEKREIQNGL